MIVMAENEAERGSNKCPQFLWLDTAVLADGLTLPSMRSAKHGRTELVVRLRCPNYRQTLGFHRGNDDLSSSERSRDCQEISQIVQSLWQWVRVLQAWGNGPCYSS